MRVNAVGMQASLGACDMQSLAGKFAANAEVANRGAASAVSAKNVWIIPWTGEGEDGRGVFTGLQ
jgi:hypothetical protein